MIANSPGADPRRGGLPPGHPALRAFLGVPFHGRAGLVGMVGVANRPGGYDAKLVELLEPFLVCCSNLIQVRRSELERETIGRALAGRLAAEALVAELASRFVDLDPEDVDEAVVHALGSLARHLDADRAVYFSAAAGGSRSLRWTRRTGRGS